jgi:TPR repeat protein
MDRLQKLVMLGCVALIAFASQAVADSLSEAKSAYAAGNYEKAAKLLLTQAQQGNADAEFNLGLMYDNGQGVPKEYKEAAEWYRRAAEQGHSAAQLNLGVMYGQGQGVPQDYKEAVKWYRRAAEQGDALAQANLGLMYNNGQGAPQNYVLAYMWTNIAATSNAPASELQQITSYRDAIARNMTPQQIAEAQERGVICKANKFNGC